MKNWLERMKKKEPELFLHWNLQQSLAGNKSWLNRKIHVQFREGLRGNCYGLLESIFL